MFNILLNMINKLNIVISLWELLEGGWYGLDF